MLMMMMINVIMITIMRDKYVYTITNKYSQCLIKLMYAVF